MKHTVADMIKMGVSAGDNVVGALPSRAYEKPLAEKFFKAVKMENIPLV